MGELDRYVLKKDRVLVAGITSKGDIQATDSQEQAHQFASTFTYKELKHLADRHGLSVLDESHLLDRLLREAGEKNYRKALDRAGESFLRATENGAMILAAIVILLLWLLVPKWVEQRERWKEQFRRAEPSRGLPASEAPDRDQRDGGARGVQR